jgi:hypothetical protein
MHRTDASKKVNGLYVVGARQRKLLFKAEQEWNLYESALILRVDLKSEEVATCLQYVSPSEVRASEESSVVFKSGTLVGDTLFTCTSTEILIFKVPEFRRLAYISLPSFNDLHHVAPAYDGNLLVANTGLDMVLKLTQEGSILQEWCVMDEAPWSRFSRDIDYRKVDSTKPHQSHPNFVFELADKVWVTRFRQRDAICLENCAKRIPIDVQRPHDGLVVGEGIYFTTVDGKIIIANRKTLKVERVIDLRTFSNNKTPLLGWCRGLLPLNERRIWVGFTRVRKTRFKENILWARTLLSQGAVESPTHIALYDIVENRCLREIDLEPYGMNIVFSIFPAPKQALARRP